MPKNDTKDEKVIIVDNPSGLTLVPLSQIRSFQQDLKQDPTPRAFKKLVDSILKHHLFLAKAIFYEDGVPYTEDGHQTMKALNYLWGNGYNKCRVVNYKLVDGRMMPDSETEYDEIMIPCQVIVPVGETREERFKDAANKILQINSRYAEFNTNTKLFENLGFDSVDFENLINETEIPELMKFNEMKGDTFLEEFTAIKPETAQYPIIPQYNERYAAVIIVCRNETDIAGIETIFEIGKALGYDKSKKIGPGRVLLAEDVLRMWKKHEDVFNQTAMMSDEEKAEFVKPGMKKKGVVEE